VTECESGEMRASYQMRSHHLETKIVSRGLMWHLRREQDRSQSRNTSRRTSRAPSPSPKVGFGDRGFEAAMTSDSGMDSDELVPPIQLVRKAPAIARSAAPPPLAAPSGCSPTMNGNSETQKNCEETLPRAEYSRGPGVIDLSTIKSLKDTIESLLRDLGQAVSQRDEATTESERLSAALASAQAQDTHGLFLRQEVKSLRNNKLHLEDALRQNAAAHEKELQEIRERFVEEVERSTKDKSIAIEDIEQSYSEALRAAQARTSDAREDTRAANDKTQELHSLLESVRAQLRQVEADRAFQVSTLDDERRQFNRFREEAVKKHAVLTDSTLENERRLAEMDSQLRTANLELGAEKKERERTGDKMRQEVELLMQSRDKARNNGSTLRRELDLANEETMVCAVSCPVRTHPSMSSLDFVLSQPHVTSTRVPPHTL